MFRADDILDLAKLIGTEEIEDKGLDEDISKVIRISRVLTNRSKIQLPLFQLNHPNHKHQKYRKS